MSTKRPGSAGENDPDPLHPDQHPSRPSLDGVRTELDSLGPIEVQADRYWGAQTQRSLLNFRIGRDRFVWEPVVIHTFGVVKQAAAQANRDLGRLPDHLAELITTAASEVAAGRFDGHFPLVVWQTGSGTQTNMNANEVIANRANELDGQPLGTSTPVHPNDHVNRGQSSNDIFPTVMHVAVVGELRDRLAPAGDRLIATLDELSGRHGELVKVGRTHLQDATPITLGQEIGSWSAQIGAALESVRKAGQRAAVGLAVGGTATGTGLNTHPDFGSTVAEHLRRLLATEFAVAPNHFAATSAHDDLANVSAALRTLAGSLMKMANDVRWLASGPRNGIGELLLPNNEPGSSIMPGKVNPTQAEALTMVVAQVFGNDTTVAFAGTQGNFQLNVYKPVILHNVLESIALLSDAMDSFRTRCLAGITPNVPRIRDHLESNLMLVTALNPHIGYEQAAKVAKTASARGVSLREAVQDLGIATGEEYDTWVDPAAMTHPS